MLLSRQVPPPSVDSTEIWRLSIHLSSFDVVPSFRVPDLFLLGGNRITRETPAPAQGPRCNDDRSAVLISGFPFAAEEQHKRGGPRTCDGRVTDAQINC
jgi:hypothetical protein